MKPTQNFKLSKRNKTLLSILGFKDHDTRCAFKRMMVQAQLQGAVKTKSEGRKPFVTGTPITV